jgi:hypothetical protein
MARPLAERFWAQVDKNGPVPAHRPELGPCWVWTGSRNELGYGRIGVKRERGDAPAWRLESAHRVSWELEHGEHPGGRLVRHECDNPPCVRPSHLVLGSDRDNALDMVERGRNFVAAGERNRRAKLTEAAIPVIRQRWDTRTTTKRELERELAAEYGVSPSLIRQVGDRKVWRHV